jgi:outer membrane protein OmpA-like peptidoglycan-associated protein
MIRRILTRLLLPVAALATLAGCGSDDSPTAPAAFDLSTIFTEDEAVITESADSINLRLIGVQFESATSIVLAAPALPILDKFARVQAHYEGAAYSVQAHTDERGSASYNLELSQERAETVRNYLVNDVGMRTDTEAVGYGEERPLVAGSSAAAWAQNRRVEVVIDLSEE